MSSHEPSQLRVLFIHSTALTPPSGENIRGNYLIEQLSGKHQIDLVTPDCDRQFPRSVRTFFTGNVERFGKNTELRHIRSGIRAALLRRRLRREYDVVYCFGLAGSILALLFAGKTRLICDFYEVDFPELRRSPNLLAGLLLKLAGLFHRAVMKRADVVLLLTRKMEDYAKQFTSARTMTVYDAADREKFSVGSREEHKRFNIIFHGGILKRDNVPALLMAVREVLGDVELGVIIAGKGEGLKECREYVRRTPELQGIVEFTGWVPYEEMPGYLAISDLGVIPATREPLNDYVIPRKAYEYMNCGIVMVMTRLEAAEEIWSDDEVLFIEEPRPDLVAKKIRRCLADRAEMERRSRALSEIGNRLNLQSECERIIELIEET